MELGTLTQKHYFIFFFILLINFILKTCFYANILILFILTDNAILLF